MLSHWGCIRVFPSVGPSPFSKLTYPTRLTGELVYLVVIAWMYVVLMMAVAEASNTNGTLLGAIVTFILYGLVPLALVVYLMGTPQRKRAIRAREAAERLAAEQAASAVPVPATSAEPDAGGHAAGAAQADGIASVRKEA